MPISVVAPTVVAFDDTSSGADITSWLWLFGDGVTSTEQNPQHEYTVPGVYVVTMTVTGPLGVITVQDVVNVITEGLIHYWPLSESSGARDDLAGAYPLAESGTVGTIPALGSALAADFTDGYLSIDPGPELSQDFTFSLWFKLPDNSFVPGPVMLFMDNQLLCMFIQQRFYFQVGEDGFGEAAWPTMLVDDGAWHHAIVWVDSATDLFVHCSLDGAATVDSAFPLSGTWTPHANQLLVGSGEGVSVGTPTGLYMQRVAWFNRALTAPERAARWNGGLGMDEVATEEVTLNVWTYPNPWSVHWPAGEDPQIMLRLSNDGGKNFGPELWRDVGKVGEYGHRVRWNRLGSARQRVFEISVTDPIEWKITAAFLKANQGDS